MSLSPCSACQRHIKSIEENCPFCQSPQRRKPAAVAGASIPRGASRSMRFAMAAAVVGGTACVIAETTPVYGASIPSGGGGAGQGAGGAGASSGGAGAGDVPDAAIAEDSNDDERQGTLPVYGAPVVPGQFEPPKVEQDAGPSDAGPESDAQDAGEEEP